MDGWNLCRESHLTAGSGAMLRGGKQTPSAGSHRYRHCVPYKISKQNILNKLPPEEKDTAEAVGQRLLDQAASICYLCHGRLQPASELLYADHVVAEAEGGKTEIANLRLVHLSCNSAKKDKNAQDVIPYLRLKRFIQENGNQLKYGEITRHFKITPGETQIEEDGNSLHLDFSDGTSTVAPVISDFAGDQTIRYAFVSLPRCAILNDDREGRGRSPA